MTRIGYDAFKNCKGLTSITIPDSVTSIGYEAFGYYYDKDRKETVKNDNFTVYGVAGSAAEKYANANGFTFVDTSALGHSFTNYIYNNDATCLADGTKTAKCDNCTATDTKTAEGTKLEHSYTGAVRNNNDGTHSFKCVNGCNQYGGTVDCTFTSTVKTAATCTAKGVTTYTCAVCGYTKDETDIPALVHNLSEWNTAKEPTIRDEGSRSRSCTRCTYTEDETLERLPANVTSDSKSGIEITYGDGSYDSTMEVKADEVNDGDVYSIPRFSVYSCSVWNIKTLVEGQEVQPDKPVLVRIPIPAGFNKKFVVVYHLGDDSSTPEKVTDVRIEGGYVTFMAYSFSMYIVLDEATHTHTYVEYTEAPSCTLGGFITKTCYYCGDTVTVDIPATGHKDANSDGRCDICGADTTNNCTHLCHKTGFMGFIWKVINTFNILFKINQYCECGTKHW